MQEIMYPVLTTRIVLNIRDAGTRGFPTELHDTYSESLKFASASCRYDDDDAEYTDDGGHDVTWIQPPLVRWPQPEASDSADEEKFVA